MDIESHIHLRSFVRPNVNPIVKAIGFALFIHSLLFIYWQPVEQHSVAEIPEWINIKLIAGFEEKENISPVKRVEDVKVKPKEVKRHAEVKSFKKKIKKDISENDTKHNQKLKEKSLSAGSATTFIKADSRPYTLDNPKPVYPTSARRRGMQGVVLLSVEVNIKGYVENIDILRSSGFRILDVAALNSVKKWKFIPAHQGSRVVASIVQVPIRFVLNKS